MSVLFIVESSVKAKSIGKYFPDFKVMATIGHFRDLPVDELGVDTGSHKPTYVTVAGKSELVSRLKTAAKAAGEIILATDPDREGEAIAAHVAFILGRDMANKIHRVTYQEVTKPAIQAALKRKRAIDWKLVKAQEGRRVLDRYVGYLVSPVLTTKFREIQAMSYLSAGRVQSVALRLVVERAEEIEGFESIEHYGVVAFLEQAGQAFTANWIRVNEANQILQELVTDKVLAEQVAARTHALKLASLSKNRVKVSPPAPLTTSSYVKCVSGGFRLTTKQAMEVAQKLFEQGLITYHRTDSPFMSEDFALQVRTYAAKKHLPLPPSIRQSKAKAGAQEAHECLRVTDIGKPDVMLDDPLHQQIYRVIWAVTLSSQLADGVDERTTVYWVNQARDRFITRGSIVVDPGFRKAETLGWNDDEERNEGDNKEGSRGQILPALTEGQILKPLKVERQTKHTQPPPLFSEKTLVAKLESLAIGRPATYASVIETIVKRGYVDRSGKTLIFTPTPIGRAVIMALRPLFSFLNYAYTAEAESQFDLIADGKSTYDVVIADAYRKLVSEIEQFSKLPLSEATAQSITALPAQSTAKKKPRSSDKIAGVQVQKSAARKTSMSAAGVPAAPKASKQRAVNTSSASNGAVCPQCNRGVLQLRTVKVGDRKGSAFFGCNQYPECRYTENVPTRGDTTSLH